MSKLKPRGTKEGRRWEKGAYIAAHSPQFYRQRALDKKNLSKEQYRNKYPHLREPNLLFREAFERAGIPIPHGTEQRQEGQIA